ARHTAAGAVVVPYRAAKRQRVERQRRARAQGLGVAVDADADDAVEAGDRAVVVDTRNEPGREWIERRVPLDRDRLARRKGTDRGDLQRAAGHRRAAGLAGIVGARQAPLADREQAVHELCLSVRAVLIVEPDLVAELVHDRGQKIDPG